MATETSNAPLNGTANGAQQPYTAAAHPPANLSATTNGTANGAAGGAATGSSAGGSDSNGVSKDEVGWYFVEQYYTTLSRSPEKLHLFYSKRSQFVSGVETEKVSVSVGQRAINERIKELDIQDCKVRVSNVDSQESFQNIVVQVIGEMSNKAAPHRKFVQTFVLAEQPNGYFVLNDIFRYIAEEEEDEEEVEQIAPETEPQAFAAPEELKTMPSSDNLVELEKAVEVLEKKLEESAAESSTAKSTSNGATPNGTATLESETKDEEEADLATTQIGTVETAPEETAKAIEAEAFEVEAPKEPVPTPIEEPPKPARTTDAQAPLLTAPKPAAPKTWANVVTASRIASPAIPSAATSNSSAPAQPKAAPAPTPAAVVPVTAPAAPPSDEGVNQPQQSPGSEWQTAGQDNVKKQNRQQPGAPLVGLERTTVLGYVKNVTERVDAALLKATLSQYGRLAYFDVSRPKNCAFVEFADAAGYNAAVAANPHSIGGELIYVEERRPRATAYGGSFNGRGAMRGGRGGSENRPPSQGRGGFSKDGGRGGFPPRGGRGGTLTPRGRGVPQAA